ncbi:MAG: hypothetical protein A3F46_06705 [Legionellales bacterium RIFCSPHIGHO2_12_FULL_42_9]|nr:MAG: hypothetical protein A3F46_06705 [Legionellales bacterium RIFCSPHIGHO2_12_FULL_42_9]
MSTLHVLGIGSPFGDDHLGFYAINILKQRPKLAQLSPQQLHLDYCDRPGMYLLELIKATQKVFLIDAIKTGAAIGTLHCFKNEKIESINSNLSTHALGIGEAMKIGAALKILPPNIVLYGIEIGDISGQLTMSNTIEHALTMLCVRIERDILSLLKRNHHELHH